MLQGPEPSPAAQGDFAAQGDHPLGPDTAPPWDAEAGSCLAVVGQLCGEERGRENASDQGGVGWPTMGDSSLCPLPKQPPRGVCEGAVGARAQGVTGSE